MGEFPELYVVAPWGDPPRLVKAFMLDGVVGCLAGPVSKNAPIIVVGNHNAKTVDLLATLKRAGYTNAARQPQTELTEAK